MKKYSGLLVLILFSLFVIQAVGLIWDKSPMHDEPNWMTIAWYLTHTWTWQADYHVLMHPPLTFYLHGIPLRLFELWFQDSIDTPPEGKLAEQFPYPYSAILRYDTVFTIAKLSMLPIALLIGWYVYRWASCLYGKGAGLFALGLYVCNPYLIAYSTNISTDIAIACFLFLTTYSFWRYCQVPSYRHLLLTGFLMGCALLARVSGVLLFPLLCLLGGGLWGYQHYVRKRDRTLFSDKMPSGSPSRLCKSPLWCKKKSVVIGVLLIFCLALVVLEAGYLFDMQPVRAFRSEQEADLLYRLFKDIPIPFGAYINSIRLHQSFLLRITRTHFFARRHWTTPAWYYNLAAFFFRNPVTMSIFLALSVLSCKGRKLVVDEMVLVIPALLVMLFFNFVFPVGGFRFLFPAYPFLFIFMSRLVTWDVVKRTSVRIIGTALLLWYGLSAASAFPHYQIYCNELGGGLEHGYQWFNLDAGQDLKGLGRYMQQHQIPVVKLAYYGTAIPEYYGVRYVPLTEPEGCRPTPGVIAISSTKLQGVRESEHACYKWLEQYEPVDKVGNAIFIYVIHETI